MNQIPQLLTEPLSILVGLAGLTVLVAVLAWLMGGRRALEPRQVLIGLALLVAAYAVVAAANNGSVNVDINLDLGVPAPAQPP